MRITPRTIRMWAATVAVASVTVGGVAQADAPRYFYVGAGAGPARAAELPDSACSQLSGVFDPGFSCNVGDATTAMQLIVGVRYNPYFEMELNYAYLGTFEGMASGTVGGNAASARYRFEASGVTLDMVPRWPVMPQFSILGRLGLVSWLVTPIDKDLADGGYSLDVGAGVEYDFTDNLAVRGEYVKYKDVGRSNTTGKSDIDVTLVSLTYFIK